MGLFDVFTGGRPPEALVGANLVIGEGDALALAGAFLHRLQQRIGRLGVGLVGGRAYAGPLPYVALPPTAAALKLIDRIQPPRLLFLGRAAERFELARSRATASYWVNAQDVRANAAAHVAIAGTHARTLLPDAFVSGDPTLGIDTLPEYSGEDGFCARFRELRERGRWIVYFAATGDGEEPLAYRSFMQILARRPGFMTLAPRDAQRYEPVYRDAIAYRLPTNRHARLITSYVPHTTRVYYIEDPRALASMYACADVVVLGGTLSASARHAPDPLTPLLLGKATVAGALGDHPLVRAAIDGGAIAHAPSPDALTDALERLLVDTAAREAQATAGAEWLCAQAGATERVLNWITSKT